MKKRTLALILAAIMMMTAIAALPATAESSGDWEYQIENGKATITKYNGSETVLTIPSAIGGYSVTSIRYSAFSRCSSLTSVTIPESVTTIDESAFDSCTLLSSITIPDSVTEIGQKAFYNTAYYNTGSNWENGVLYIGRHLIEAKTDISGSYRIRSDTKTICEYAFFRCTSLTGVTIPEGVKSIGVQTFRKCSSLASVTIPASVTGIGIYAFYECSSLTVVNYAGTQEQWNEIGVGNQNDPLNNANKFYDYHEYIAVVTPPACTAGGYTTYTCSLCGYSYVADETPAFGHDFGEWTVTTPAACLADGVETRVCANDPTHVETRAIPALGHDFSEWDTFKAPGCETPGTEYRYCLNDGSHIEMRPAAAVGHSLSHVDACAPGCENPGNIEYWKCENCGKFYSDSSAGTELTADEVLIAAIGHDWSDWFVLIEPTSSEIGVEFRFCLNEGSHAEFSAIVSPTEILSAFNEKRVEFRAVPKFIPVYGDATGDGAIDASDIILIAQYILDNNVEISAAAADATGDGAIDTSDIILIAQYILDNAVVLGPQNNG